MTDAGSAISTPSAREAAAVSRGQLWRGIADTLRPPAGSVEGILPPLMILLTMVSGIVDAVAYLGLGHVFVANMTGNVVFLGFSAAGARGLSTLGSLLALACFLPGGIAAGRLAGRLGESPLVQLRAATGAQVVLCAAAIATVAAGRVDSTSKDVLIALLALAMGVQNATARRLAVADLTTTVLTLTLTGIAADSRLAGGTGTKTGRRLLAVVSMALGALIGALLVLKVDLVAPLGLAGAILATVCVGSHLEARHRREPSR
jgi:uncharacterized membrane protein YoaK (UPF0700 family)